MTTATKVKWSLSGEYFQACNCDYGCPCEFEAPPTRGFCDGMGAWRISQGRYGRVNLDGLALGFALHSPAALHKGNITLAVFVDEQAKANQRDALLNIASGKMGGLPFEIFAQLVTKMLNPQFVPFAFSGRGRTRGVKMGNAVSMGFEPVKNPVTGEPESVRVDHATGFLFKAAQVVSSTEARSNVPSLTFSYPNKAGFLARFKYGN